MLRATGRHELHYLELASFVRLVLLGIKGCCLALQRRRNIGSRNPKNMVGHAGQMRIRIETEWRRSCKLCSGKLSATRCEASLTKIRASNFIESISVHFPPHFWFVRQMSAQRVSGLGWRTVRVRSGLSRACGEGTWDL